MQCYHFSFSDVIGSAIYKRSLSFSYLIQSRKKEEKKTKSCSGCFWKLYITKIVFLFFCLEMGNLINKTRGLLHLTLLVKAFFVLTIMSLSMTFTNDFFFCLCVVQIVVWLCCLVWLFDLTCSCCSLQRHQVATVWCSSISWRSQGGTQSSYSNWSSHGSRCQNMVVSKYNHEL